MLGLNGCSSVADIVPQTSSSAPNNSALPPGQDIARANALLDMGKLREAANAYFQASNNYASPERERLMLQAAELAAIFNDTAITQEYLAPLSFSQLDIENQSRFRLVQSQLALNDRNYRETLRILPQRVNGLSDDLAKKILQTRMHTAQSSGDKLALVQELILQEPNLKQAHEVSLNHDRIWNHAQQIPSIQLNQAKNTINHPIAKQWLSLAQLARVAKFGSASSKQSLRSDLARWIQSNPNHPGMKKALDLLNAEPTTTVTPYSAGNQQTKTITSTTTKTVTNSRKVNPRPIVVRPKPVVVRPKPVVKTQPKTVPTQPTGKKKESAYERIKRELNLP